MSVEGGEIINESASGVLLEIKTELKLEDRIWILSFPGDDPADQEISIEDLKSHPLCRSGEVIRIDKPTQMGIHFDEDVQDRPQYQRWYRGDSTILTLFDGKKAVFNFSGPLQIETVSLLDRILKRLNYPFNDIIISFNNVLRINKTALTMLRTSLRRYDLTGVVLTIITSNKETRIIEKGLDLKNGFIVNTADHPEPKKPENDKISEDIEIIESEHERPLVETEFEKVLLIAQSLSVLHRLSKPFERLDIETMKTQSFREAAELIAYNPTRLVVIDFDLEHSSSLIDINSVRRMQLSKVPPALVIGPQHIGDLVKAALSLPVKIYLSKPSTDRDYTQALQSILNQV